MDRAKIRKALDHFENDQYVDAKDIISQEVSGKRDVFLKDKLGLQNDFNPAPEVQDADNKDADNKDADNKDADNDE